MDWIIEMLSHRGEHLLGRFGGPLNFRLVVMPLMVTFLAIRAHRRDVRDGKGTFLWAFFKSPTERRRLLRSGLRDFGKVFVVACVIDTTYQILVLKSFYPGEMLVVAVVCAIVPYFLVRGPITRLAQMLIRSRARAAGTEGGNRG
jgi:hypothetical protein